MKHTLLLFLAGCAESSVDCSTVTDTWADYRDTFFSVNCTTCHQHSSDFATQGAVSSQVNRIESTISSGGVPRDTTLSAAEKSRVLAWLSCGAP